jgi:hypothetical protein
MINNVHFILQTRVAVKGPREETDLRYIMSEIMSAPSCENMAPKRDSQQQQGINARILNVSVIQSIMVDGEKFEALKKYLKFCLKK